MMSAIRTVGRLTIPSPPHRDPWQPYRCGVRPNDSAIIPPSYAETLVQLRFVVHPTVPMYNLARALAPVVGNTQHATRNTQHGIQPPMTTPMRSQYLAIKKQYPDIIVLFRLGDFYETFDDDARIVSSVCDVVLTSRPVGADERVPLAGVPYHAVDGYIAKLINAGYKVAIAEQIGNEPPKGEKLVPRVVRRVVTPGTLVEPGLLPDKRNNYLAALVMDQDLDRPHAGWASAPAWPTADISTGEFAATEIDRWRRRRSAVSQRSWAAWLLPKCSIRSRIRAGRSGVGSGGESGERGSMQYAARSTHQTRSRPCCNPTTSPPTPPGVSRKQPPARRCSTISGRLAGRLRLR